MALLDDDVTAEEIDELEKRRDLMALHVLRIAYAADDESANARVSEREEQLNGAYRRVLAGLVGEIMVAVKAGMWVGKDCQEFHRQVSEAEGFFADYGEADYLKLLEEEKPDLPDDLDLPEDLDGYGSDDSDDECEPQGPPPKDRGELRRYRKKVRAAKKLHKEKVEKGTRTSGKAVHSWRTYGDLEPEPDAIIQHVIHLRREMDRKKDELQPERDKHGGKLQKLTPKYERAASELQAMKDAPLGKVSLGKVRTQAERVASLKKCIDAERAALGDITSRNTEIVEEIQRENPTIRHSPAEWTRQSETDFKLAKIYFEQGNIEEIRGLKTKFCIAQYRGITYNHMIFNAEQRRLSRNLVAVGEPVYSMSVLYAAGVRPDDYFEGRCSDEDKKHLDENAAKLKAVLLAKREKADVVVNGYKYSSHADAIQDIYTNKYDYIHATIQAYLDHQSIWKEKALSIKGDDVAEGRLEYPEVEFLKDYSSAKDGSKEDYLKKQVEVYMARCENIEARNNMNALKKTYGVIPPSDWTLFDGLLNGRNPFVSTGDTPRHALKYAYGMKFYKGHENERLAPRWNADGKALHPYSGKVFVSLHALDDYLDDAPNHVPSMNMAARIVVGLAIADERETTFPAYIDGERVVLEHICKYPSFNRPWRKLFQRKYGLDKESYDDIADAVKGQEVQQKGEYRNLEAWLVNFHEARLVEIVRRYALSKGMLLVYRNSHGELSRGLTSTNAHKGSRFVDPTTRKFTSTFDTRAQRKVNDGSKDDRGQLDAPKKSGPAKTTSSKAPRQTFLQRVAAQGYQVNNVPGDGNCFFHSLLAAAQAAAYQPAMPLDHVRFRAWLVGCYVNYPDIVLAQKATVAYRAEMAQQAQRPGQVSRWGSDAEVILFCRETSSCVIILSPRFPNGQARFETFGVQALRTLYLVHAGGDHWQWATRQ